MKLYTWMMAFATVMLSFASVSATEKKLQQIQDNLAVLEQLNEPDTAKFFALARETEQLAEQCEEWEQAAKCYVHMINYNLLRLDDLEEGARLLDILRDFTERTGAGKSRMYTGWQNLVLIYLGMENRLMAASETNKMAAYAQRQGDKIGMSYAHMLYGHLSEHTYEAAIENFQTALRYACEAENKQLEFNIYERMATIAFNNAEYEDVLQFVDKMEQMDTKPFWAGQVSEWHKLASHVYMKHGAEAEKYYRRMKQTWDNDEVYPIAKSNYAMALAAYHCYFGKLEEMPYFFDFVSPQQKIQLQVEYYQAKKDFEQAFYYQLQLDSLFTQQNIDQQRADVAASNAFFNNQELREENQQLEMDKAQSKNQRDLVIIIAMSIMLMGAGYTIYTTRRHNLHLTKERDNTERQRRIAEEQRAIAEEERNKAMRLNEMKTAFIQNMSHEVRTPLNNIIGFNDLLNHSGTNFSPEERNEMLHALDQQSTSLVNMLNNVVFLSQIDAKGISPNLESVRLYYILSAALDEMKKKTAPGVKVHLDAPEDVVANTDSELLFTALSHVLDNAAKFTREGQISLSYTDGCIVVANTGVTIPAESAEAIFERFEKLGRYDSGFGLGLSIARECLALIGATIHLDTTYTDGVRFIIRIS